MRRFVSMLCQARYPVDSSARYLVGMSKSGRPKRAGRTRSTRRGSGLMSRSGAACAGVAPCRPIATARASSCSCRPASPGPRSRSGSARWSGGSPRASRPPAPAGRAETTRRCCARAVELVDLYLDGRAYPASVRWVDTMTTRWASCTLEDAAIRVSSRLRSMPTLGARLRARPRARAPARPRARSEVLGARRPVPAHRAGPRLSRGHQRGGAAADGTGPRRAGPRRQLTRPFITAAASPAGPRGQRIGVRAR